jgi:hypothetical protein
MALLNYALEYVVAPSSSITRRIGMNASPSLMTGGNTSSKPGIYRLDKHTKVELNFVIENINDLESGSDSDSEYY